MLMNHETKGELIVAEDDSILPMNNSNFSNGAIQTKNRYVTAMQVLKPRNLNRVISKCVEEASIAGEEFIYSWKQGGSIIEGLTIGAALSIVRNFGNSFVDVDVEERANSYIFTASWDKVKLVQLSSALKSLENGYEDEDTLFPQTKNGSTPVERVTPHEKDELLKITESLDDNNSKPDSGTMRARILRVNQEILNAVDGDFKSGTEILEKMFSRKFKMNASFASQLTSDEINTIDGVFSEKMNTLTMEAA